MLGRRRSSGDGRTLRKDQTGMDPFKAGALTLLVAALVTWFGFTKDLPFTQGFRVKAVFEQSVALRPNSPVRIAGVNVGKVKEIERFGKTGMAVVTMELNDEALPIHDDATMKIRPRIFLEGNYFVEVRPGSPGGDEVDDGDTIPVTQTATPVQLDEVLTALNTDARQDLKDLLDGYGTALTHQPTPAEDRGQDPAVRGETAAESLNDALDHGGDAFRGTAVVNQALLGTEPHDLSRLVRGLGRVARGLGRNEEQLKDLVTNFNRTMAAFAAEETSLRSSIRLLGPTADAANRALGSLNAAFPPTRAFAREILPGVRETPATIEASFPWIDQTRRLLSARELRGLSRELRPTVANLAAVIDETVDLLPQVDLVSRCATDVILPTGDVKIEDGPLSTGVENYKEFWWAMVGLSSEGQNFDGNGNYVRFQPGGGSQTLSTGTIAGRPSEAGQLLGNALLAPIGTRPKYPGRRSPYRPDFPCHRNQPPNLNGPAANIGPPDRLTSGGGAARRSQRGGGGR